MNRRLIVVIVGVVIVLIVIGFLYTQGYFQNLQWQTGTMILAVLAGPYKFIMGWIKGGETERIAEKHEQMKQDEIKHREETDAQIKAKQEKIAQLDKEIQLLDTKIQLIEVKKAQVQPEVEKMSSQQLQKEGQDLFGS